LILQRKRSERSRTVLTFGRWCGEALGQAGAVMLQFVKLRVGHLIRQAALLRIEGPQLFGPRGFACGLIPRLLLRGRARSSRSDFLSDFTGSGQRARLCSVFAAN